MLTRYMTRAVGRTPLSGRGERLTRKLDDATRFSQYAPCGGEQGCRWECTIAQDGSTADSARRLLIAFAYVVRRAHETRVSYGRASPVCCRSGGSRRAR